VAISKMFQCENLNFLEECHLGSKELQEISCWGFGGVGGRRAVGAVKLFSLLVMIDWRDI